MFVILAVIIVLSSIATVLTKSIIRAATYLLFVLLGTAGLYFLMGYTFLGAVQTMVYAGGIIVLYVFAILLTDGAKDQAAHKKMKDASWGVVIGLVGFLTFVFVLFKQELFKGIAALGARPNRPARLTIQSTRSATSCCRPEKKATCSPSRQSASCYWPAS